MGKLPGRVSLPLLIVDRAPDLYLAGDSVGDVCNLGNTVCPALQLYGAATIRTIDEPPGRLRRKRIPQDIHGYGRERSDLRSRRHCGQREQPKAVPSWRLLPDQAVLD